MAEVEGALHRQDPADVHFHEVGGHDAVVDVVGTMAALEVLGIDQVAASPVATGTGMVRSAHGLLPNPSPAVVRLLAGAPVYGRETGVELTTPTGAALLATLATSFGPLPAMTVAASGFGAGSRELDDLPNCTQVVVGTASAEADEPGAAGGPGQPVTVVEANLDDVTGEQLGQADRRAPRRRRTRRLGDAGGHEEGSAGPRAPRPLRPGPDGCRARGRRPDDRDVRRAGGRSASGGRRPGGWPRSSSAARRSA